MRATSISLDDVADASEGQTLAALGALLDGSRLAPPDDFPDVVAAAGEKLGLGVVMYLADYQQRELIPWTPSHVPAGLRMGIDSTLAGRAFQTIEPVTGERDGRSVLWVPLLDGAERLGVLDLSSTDGVDVRTDAFRERCRWFASLVGHLVVVVGTYGDGLDRVRRVRPRTIAAELLWQLLPPTTYGCEGFTVSALLEPSREVAGDAFDYAVSGRVAHLNMFDGAGHDMSSGVIASVALAACRNARRNGGTLDDAVRSVDSLIASELGLERFATGVFAQLDLDSGRLRYVVAGHPEPLVVREGKVVKSLTAGRRPLLGLDTAELTVAEEQLEAGDWLVLYTDGVTEARFPGTRELFGIHRLVDTLEREAASGHTAPEVLRRVLRAVLEHQNGDLQDDATLLIAQWGIGSKDQFDPTA